MNKRITLPRHFLFVFILFVFTFERSFAQDFYFSQYANTPVNINPALLSTEKDIKVSLHYHQTELFNSLVMKNVQTSLTYPFLYTNAVRAPAAIGVSVQYNNTGRQGLVNSTGAGFSFSQGVILNKWSQLSAGLQASYYFYSNSNPRDYTTGSQWVDGTGFESSQGINESINFETIHLFTVSTGINWHINDKNSSKGNLGVSVYQLNKPRYSFMNEKNSLDRKYIVHADYKLFNLKTVSISPRMLLVYQNINIVSLGTVVNYAFKSDNPFLPIRECNLQLGLDYRVNQSGMVSLNIEQSKYIFGVSYAMGMNTGKVYTNYGSNFEMCLVLKFAKRKKTVPKSTEYTIGETRLVFNNGIDNSKKPENYNQENQNNYQSDSINISGEKYRVQLRQDFKFKFNDAALTADAQLYLDDLARMLKQNPRLRVEVIGHTDDVGTEEANQLISGKRAQVVIDYLVTKGVKAGRLKLTAKGKSEPVAPNTTDENKAKNRRVEFIIYSE